MEPPDVDYTRIFLFCNPCDKTGFNKSVIDLIQTMFFLLTLTKAWPLTYYMLLTQNLQAYKTFDTVGTLDPSTRHAR